MLVSDWGWRTWNREMSSLMWYRETKRLGSRRVHLGSMWFNDVTYLGVNVHIDVEDPWGNCWKMIYVHGGFSTPMLVYRRVYDIIMVLPPFFLMNLAIYASKPTEAKWWWWKWMDAGQVSWSMILIMIITITITLIITILAIICNNLMDTYNKDHNGYNNGKKH